MNSPTARWLHQISPCASIQPAGFAARSLCDATITPADWIEPKRVIYDHELVLFQQGQYRIQLDDQFYDCPENTFIIIPPNHWHITTCTQKGKRHYAHFNWQHETHKADSPVMTFFPARPKHSCFRLAPQIIPSDIFHGTIQSPAIVYDLIEKLSLMLCNTNTHEQLASRGVLLELLIRLLDPQPNHSPQQHRQEELAHDVRNELDQALSQPRKSIEIRKLLGSMGHSYEHLARVFRQQYGLTPTDYVQSIRIERAKHLLRHTNMKVSAIAQSVGYQDAIYFSRLFKRHTHLSPGKFRR